MRIRLHIKIFIFIAIFIITRQIKVYGILMLFAFIHELGHMVAGLALGFKPYSLEIMPFGLAISFKSKAENYNNKIKKGTMLTLKKIIIALAGPLTNIILILIIIISKFTFLNIKKELLLYSNILIAIFNMLPIYPLDGGRIISGILHIFFGRRKSNIYTNTISNICIILFTAICSIAILFFQNISILFILGYLWVLVINENRKFVNKQRLYSKLGYQL